MKNIIFDIDGTLWDSTDIVAESWNDAILAETGRDLKLDGARLKQLFGKTMDDIAKSMLPDLDYKRRMEVCQACYDYEDRHLAKYPGVFYDGVQETLKKLAEKYNLYVVSNCQVGYIELTLKHAGLTDVVKDHVCFGDNNLPKGENIDLLMRRNDIAKNDAVYVGDIQGDYDACQVAQIPMIYASYGFGTVATPDYTINDIKELPALMEKINA